MAAVGVTLLVSDAQILIDGSIHSLLASNSLAEQF
jgi:hypothetical protein